MSDIRQAAQLALDALEYHTEQTRPIHQTSLAITALRAALAGPVSDTLPPLPEPEHPFDSDDCTYACPEGFSADQMRSYAAAALAAERERQHEQMRQLMSELIFDEPAAVAEPVASVTECEACFTPDVCQLRGTCDHYAAERLRVAAPPQREPYDQTALGLCNACGWKAVGPDGCLNCAPQREPLTDEQMHEIRVELGIGASPMFMEIIMLYGRAIERAHGIAPASAPKEQA